MKKIIITESQYKRLFREQYEKLDFIPEPMASDSSAVAALNIPVKPTASGKSKRKLTDVFSKDFLNKEGTLDELKSLGITIDGIHINELLSGFNIKDANNDQFDDNLVPALKKIIDNSGVGIQMITGGKDKYHTWGNHMRGKAIDFTITSGTDENQMKIEKAAIDLIKNRDYPNLQFINEYKHVTDKGTGNHFHLVINGKADLNYYHFIDKDTLEAKVDNKKPLSFNGTGEYVFKKWFSMQQKVDIDFVPSRPAKVVPTKNYNMVNIKKQSIEQYINNYTAIIEDKIAKEDKSYKKKKIIKTAIDNYLAQKTHSEEVGYEQGIKIYGGVLSRLKTLLNEV